MKWTFSNADLNDALRSIVSCVIRAVGVLLGLAFFIELRLDPIRRAFLRRRLTGSAAVERWGPQLEARIDAIEGRLRSRGVETWRVETSGSTRAPKRLLYTAARVRERHWSFFEAYARVLRALGVRRQGFFVMAAIKPDRSLTSLLLTRTPRFQAGLARLESLQTPHVLERVPELRELADRYGDSALRLWLLVVSQPAMLYATNPSTLAAFADAVSSDWDRTRALCRDWVHEPRAFSSRVQDCYRAIESRGAQERLEWIAGLEQPLPSLAEFFSRALPALEVVSSWDGGYVGPFLSKVRSAFGVRFVPMYSMSTEVIETRPVVSGGRVAFLPISPGVLHEFVAEGGGPILDPRDLRTGGENVLVVSDRFGLRRYYTEDVFVCRGRVHGLPDLAFVRRCGIAHSFTGEKLTGEQVQSAIEALLAFGKEAGLWAESPASFSLFPALPGPASVGRTDEARYELVQIAGSALAREAGERLVMQFERELGDANNEFRSKRESGRLGLTRYRHATIEQVAESLMPKGWQSQFKFLPLYSRPLTSRSLQSPDRGGGA